ncbi:hypothetical protein SAMN05892883_1472 [Jatrophihabitans sp. GAS493]|uniref:hypothetical protein n=1 Tax=Jatrophihabitans sp. GAS493 TaxID=1907575 RepID=UPI000BB8059C|nr:hypothetical protein [Jatrophihabitans sp. GAS493]SOD72026.1 hypothetical protein SAMN05892883_1472 [Jatrophihabitans sp. GAS493]
MQHLSPEALERARRTILVSDVFAELADEIVAAVYEVPDAHVLVVVVDGNHKFAGMHHVKTEELAVKVPPLEGDGGWTMVFSTGATPLSVRQRTDKMADLAQQRINAIERINARRSGG